MLNRFKSVDILGEIPKIIQSDEKELVELNQSQLLRGKTSKDGQVGTYVLEDYADLKYFMNPLAGHGNVDLKLTGAFYDGFFITVDNSYFTFDSKDGKTYASESGEGLGLSLTEKYGNDIFGLTVQNKIKYATGTFKTKILAYLKGKILS